MDNMVPSDDSHGQSLKLHTTPENKVKPPATMIRETFAEVFEGCQQNYTIYMIEDYMYTKEKLEKDVISMKCRHYKRKCRGRAQVQNNTLFVIRISGEHSCNKKLDPNQKDQMKMESKMKHLARTTEDSFKKIYDYVCLENTVVASCIPYSRIEAAMRIRRNNAMGDPFQ